METMMERQARQAKPNKTSTKLEADKIDGGLVHSSALPVAPADPSDKDLRLIEDPEEAARVANELGMEVFSSKRRKALKVLGDELTRAGIVEIGRGLYMVNSDLIHQAISGIQKQLRRLDWIRGKNPNKEDTIEGVALREDLMKLYREFVMAAQKIAESMVESDKTTREGAGDAERGVPSFRPGAAITAVSVTVNNAPKA